MWYAICVVLGIVAGFFVSMIVRKPIVAPKYIGTLKVISDSDEPQPYLFVELEEDAKYLYNEKNVTMDVKVVHQNSQN